MDRRPMILLDTHTLVWLDAGSRHLGSKTRNLVDEALRAGELLISAISFWEIAMLVEKGRLEIEMPLAHWRRSLLDNGLREVGLDGEIAVRSARLTDFHGDPADRMIVATALGLPATLCTADGRILSWDHSLARQDARE